MKKLVIAAVVLFALFIFGALFAGGIALYLIKGRAAQSRTVFTPQPPRTVQPQQFPPPIPRPNAAARPNANAVGLPAAPSRNGSVVERWDGYYYYSGMISFEDAVAQKVQRTHFWFDARRTATGSFRASCNENSDRGEANVAGTLDRATGALKFDKTYAAQTVSWHYEGQWVPGRKRIEGTWGDKQGGFVLFPRRLSEAEIARYDNAVELQTVEVDMLDGDRILRLTPPNPKADPAPPAPPPPAPSPKRRPGHEPKKDEF